MTRLAHEFLYSASKADLWTANLRLEIEDMGDSEVLRNRLRLHQLGQRLVRSGIIPAG
jgi:hypothetical protein